MFYLSVLTMSLDVLLTGACLICSFVFWSWHCFVTYLFYARFVHYFHARLLRGFKKVSVHST